MKVGDIVTYINDWKPNRQWLLESLYKGDICKIVLIRDGKTTYEKNGLTHSNPSIVNLDINKITPYGEVYSDNN
jgi:hypothetical protein